MVRQAPTGSSTSASSRLMGRLVRSERYTNTGTMVIDVPGASGQYFVRLSNGTGERTTFKVLKR